MATIRIEKDIEKCNECPMCKTERVGTPDPFEVVFAYHCGATGTLLAENVDRISESPDVPGTCPFLVRKTNVHTKIVEYLMTRHPEQYGALLDEMAMDR